MSSERSDEKQHRVLGRVDRSAFVGRSNELLRIVKHAESPHAAGLLLLLAPTAGVSELLRQAYDDLFNKHGNVIPVYFSLQRETRTAVSTAIEFLNTFLIQYLAFRRNEPSLCLSSATLSELLELAPADDYDWLAQLVEAYNRERFNDDDESLVRWCLSAPQRVPTKHGRLCLMVDVVERVSLPSAGPTLTDEIMHAFSRANGCYVLAGLRRQLLSAAHSLQGEVADSEVIRIEALTEEDGRVLVEQVAARNDVAVSAEVRDLLVQQFESSPFLITSFIQAAREFGISLTSYLACEKLYVDEMMGGRLGRYFAGILEEIVPDLSTRRALVRALYESATSGGGKASHETWKRISGLEAPALELLLRGLHIQEFISWDGLNIQTDRGPIVWKDYLRARYRLEIANEPRALVVADTILEALQRAPQTMARYYRREAAIGLRQVLGRFDNQLIPSVLLDYSRFREVYKGLPLEQIISSLHSNTEITRLPQVVHVASGAAFKPDIRELCDEERCAVAHAFAEGKYTDSNQVVWLAAEIDSKLEADLRLTQSWFESLASLARESGFHSAQIWLIAREGFQPEACEFLAGKRAFGSSRQQFELLTDRLGTSVEAAVRDLQSTNEFEMVVPMGGDNELIVAHAVEEIARRLSFRPEAVNQIKHAVVEAFINAAEHSLSPERRIYQRFRAEDDKLVITISSRGIVPLTVEARNGEMNAAPEEETLGNRRGLGLNLIRTLMDEVEFERVDDGTSLRMTKYLRP
jgi:anti-sigma regulatory factor (Ser/Thr protein kinase)